MSFLCFVPLLVQDRVPGSLLAVFFEGSPMPNHASCNCRHESYDRTRVVVNFPGGTTWHARLILMVDLVVIGDSCLCLALVSFACKVRLSYTGISSCFHEQASQLQALISKFARRTNHGRFGKRTLTRTTTRCTPAGAQQCRPRSSPKATHHPQVFRNISGSFLS